MCVTCALNVPMLCPSNLLILATPLTGMKCEIEWDGSTMGNIRVKISCTWEEGPWITFSSHALKSNLITDCSCGTFRVACHRLELCSHHIYNTGDTSSFVLHVTVSVWNTCTKLYIEIQSPMKLSLFLDRWYHIPVTGTWKSHRQFTPAASRCTFIVL